MISGDTLAPVLAAYGFSTEASLTPLEGGLINQTLRVDEAGRRVVLQQLHPVFGPTVHLDIEAITAHLAQKGLATPRLVRTRDGALWTTDASGHVYRMLTWLEGRTVQAVDRPETAHAAGRLVGRFHGAVADLQHDFHFVRAGVHDTSAHLLTLRRAVHDCADHPDHARIAPLAEAIGARIEALAPLPELPARIAHGDLKIANVLFDRAGEEAIALLDLDTMGRLTIAMEMGDAFRSWCNPGGEDAGRVHFDAGVFEAGIVGYAAEARALLTPDEVASLVAGVELIALELAARFCADALYERYFGWNPRKFASRSEHNRVRAESQRALADSVRAQRSALEAVVRRHFGG